jgi:hypothetical protein
MPPAFATAVASPGGQAPAIGAIRIGARNPNRRQKLSARQRGPVGSGRGRPRSVSEDMGLSRSVGPVGMTVQMAYA